MSHGHGSPSERDHDTTRDVRGAIAGDRRCLGALVERLSPLLLAYARFRLGPVLQRRHEPEDLVQEAWLTTIPRLPDLVSRHGRITPVLVRFLSSTIQNRVHNLLRSEARRGVLPGGSSSASEVVRALPDERTGVITGAIRRELGDQVGAILAELDDTDREIVLLRCLEQLSNETVGVLVSLSAEAVSKRYHRALARIRARLPGSAFDEVGDAPAAE